MNKKTIGNPWTDENHNIRDSKGELYVRKFKKDNSNNKSKVEKEQKSVTRKPVRNNSFHDLTKHLKKINPKGNPLKGTSISNP